MYTQQDVDNYFSTNEPYARYGDFEDMFDMLPDLFEETESDTNGSVVESASLMDDQSIEVIFNVHGDSGCNSPYDERYYRIIGHLEGEVIMDDYEVCDGSMFVVDSFERIGIK